LLASEVLVLGLTCLGAHHSHLKAVVLVEGKHAWRMELGSCSI
jgi:hypothetical protein